jgi:rhomboid protease GluP
MSATEEAVLTNGRPEAPFQTFCTYLAKQFIAKKGFGFTRIPEVQPLAAACDIVLAHSDGYNLTILCMIDREKNPDRIFTLGSPEVEAIGKACLKYTGRTTFNRMPVYIWIMEVGPGAADQQARLGQFERSSMLSKVVPFAMTVDTASGAVWTNNKTLISSGGYQDFVATLLASPRESDADLTPPVVTVAPPSFPILTRTILAALLAVFAAEIHYGIEAPTGLLQPSIKTLVAFGGLTRNLVQQSGEWYRLFSAPFLHADAGHLAMNMVALFIAGRVLERLIGRAWLGAIYVIAALCGSWLSLLLGPATIVSVGASGAIMGLFTAMLVISLHYPPGPIQKGLQMNAIYVLIPSLLPLASALKGGARVDYAAHFGGAIGGAAVGFAMLEIWSRSEATPRYAKAAAAVAIAGLLALAYPAISIWQHFSTPQQVQAESFVKQLVPAELYPKDAANMKLQAAWLSAHYPRDPRLHLHNVGELLKANDRVGAEREARAGLAEEDLWRSMLAPQLPQTLRAALAVAIAGDRRSEALAIARPVCAGVTSGPVRKMLDDQKLCGT